MELGKITQETLDIMKGSLGKSITTSTGLIGYNLEAPAKQLVPFLSPLRNRIPRVTSKTGTAVNWKAITAINAAGKATTTESNRGNGISYTVADHIAAFKIIALQDSVTLEAIAGGRNFEDVRSQAVTNLLLRVMCEEEKIILGGNITSLGTVTAPTVTGAETGGTIAAGTYLVQVSALTLTAANRVLLNTQIANLSLPVFDGVTALSDAGTSGALAGVNLNKLTCTVPAVKGAFAYAWFVGTAGALKLQMVTTVPAATFTKLVTGGTASTAVTGDTSGDAASFDGIVPQILGGSGYFKDCANAQLTKGNGGVAELDAYNSYVFQQFKISPTRYLVSEQLHADITSAIIAGLGAPTLFVNNSEKADITGNYLATKYINKSCNGQQIIIESHPWLPNGSMVALCDSLPYPNANVPNVMEIECGYDYMQLEYAFANPLYEFEVRTWEVLKHYFPAACGFFCNVKPGIT